MRHPGPRTAFVGLAVAAASLVPAVAAGGRPGQPGLPGRSGHPGPPGIESSEGTATFTDLTGPGACSFLGEPPDNLHVGLSTAEFAMAGGCGGYLDVTGPSGTVRVKITDHCRRCAPGLIDVTRTAFVRIADVAAGRAPVTYRLVRNPPLAEPISLRVKDGSSRWWLQIQALDHGNPIARFEVLQEEGWRALVHTPDNYWEASDPGLGAGPFTVRLTDVFDQQVTVDDIVLAPGEVQPTTARLYPARGEEPATAGPTPTAAAPEPALTPPFGSSSPEAITRSRPAAPTREPREPPTGPEGTAPLWPLLVVIAGAVVVARTTLVARRRRAVSGP